MHCWLRVWIKFLYIKLRRARVRVKTISRNHGEWKFNLKDHSREEITAFVESLDSKQFNNVRNWIEKIPRLQKDFEFNCTECNHMIKDKLEGMTSFLY